MAEAAIRLAVVGHTNAGKTSLLRTLTRDRGFGEVSLRPATTRHVEAAVIDLGAGLALELDDTPGLEDSMGLLDALGQAASDPREPGPDRLRRFLALPDAQARFAQEAKALRQLLACDLALYVVDAREPVSGKYEDEFVILSWAGRPCLVVLNLVADPAADPARWRECLQRGGLHNVVAFDTVVFDAASEARLWRQVAALLPRAEACCERLIARRAAERASQHEAAAGLIAGFLIDAAALRLPQGRDLVARVRERERALNADLLALFGFGAGDYAPEDLPIRGDEWSLDPFDPDVLTALGLSLAGSAAKGAVVGAGIDLMTGFTTLGTASLIGGAVGAGLDAASRAGRELRERLAGERHERVAASTLMLLARRACLLARDLARRGHAAVRPLTGPATLATPLPDEARIARLLAVCARHPEWSALGASPVMEHGARAGVERALAEHVQAILAQDGAKAG